MLPVEDEGGLHDPENMKGFIEKISTVKPCGRV
jgi:hypothetical protein